jgi:hypothetical protein
MTWGRIKRRGKGPQNPVIDLAAPGIDFLN